ncbi:MAG TPA: hypothetical protein VF058_02095 [Actinomycetota bacterium]
MGPSVGDAFPRLPARLTRWLRGALILTSAGVVASWLFLAVVHLGDRYQVRHRQGVWIALAQHLDAEGLYPQIFDGAHYGGVRYMPGPFVLHGLVARVTGEYLTSGKLVALLATAALLVLLYVTLVRLGSPRPVAFGLTAAVVAGGAGLLGGTSVGGDVLPVLFQLAAVALVLRTRSDARAVGAGALCTLALLSRFNALWAPLALAVWLWPRDRRRLLVFAGSFVGLTVVSLGLLHVASDGRMYDNLVRFAAGGILSVGDAATAPLRFLDAVFEGAVAQWVLLPVAAFGLLTLRRVEPSVFAWGLLFAAAILLVVFADIGTGSNQLIDLVVLMALVTGQLTAAFGERGDEVFASVVAVALVWVTFTGVAVHMREDLKEAGKIVLGAESPFRPDPLAGELPAGATLLSEDPGLPALRGQTPVVFDPFMLNRIDRREPELVDDLVDRIREQEFDALVLVETLEGNDGWWRDYHFGTRVVAAMREAYRWDRTFGGYHLYRPAQVTP